jgi:hypothetical protein
MTFNTFYTSLQPVAYALDRDVPDDDDGDGGGGGTAPGLGAGLRSGRHAVTRINHCTPTTGNHHHLKRQINISSRTIAISQFSAFSLFRLCITRFAGP